jgi:Domain of unknown function (DUF4124)
MDAIRPVPLEAIVRKIPILLFTHWLLLAPALAAATTYKCVVDGKTTYSQEKCGKDAEKVEAKGKLSGVNKATPIAPDMSSDRPAHARDEAASASAPAAAGSSDTQAANDCQTRLAAYRESQACFGRYRINADVMDPEAFKQCKTVPEPTDCLAGNAQ